MLEAVLVILIVGPLVCWIIGAFVEEFDGGPAYKETPAERAVTIQILQFTGLAIGALVLMGLILYVGGRLTA
jgi:hypothetical protein